MANTRTHSEWLRSNALVGVDDWCRTAFAPATFPREYYGGFEHFSPGRLTSATTYPGFTVTTLVGAGTLVMEDRVGGWLGLTGTAVDGQGIQMQSDGEAYLPTANQNIWFEASIEVEDADDIDWFVGLAETDTNVFSTDPTELIAHRGTDASANIDFQVREAGTGAAVDSGTDLANNTAVRVGFKVEGVTSVTPYIDGVAGTAVTTNLPASNNLRVTFGMLNGATTASQALLVDWYRIIQLAA